MEPIELQEYLQQTYPRVKFQVKKVLSGDFCVAYLINPPTQAWMYNYYPNSTSKETIASQYGIPDKKKFTIKFPQYAEL